MSADTAQVTTSTNGRKRGKIKLLSRDRLDRRLLSSKQFDVIASGIAQDLGGEERLTTIQKTLIEAFTGAALESNDLNTKMLLGQPVDILKRQQVISSLVRIASRIGVGRVMVDATPTVAEYVKALNASRGETP